MVTPEKLEFYMNYMDAEKMRLVENKLYLVDNVVSGWGLISMLRVLRYYYQVHLKRSVMPDIILLGMGLLFKFDQRYKIWVRSAETKTLIMSGMPKEEISSAKIQSFALQISTVARTVMTLSWIQNLFCKEVHLPAQNWCKDYEKVIQRGGLGYKSFYERLKTATINFAQQYEHDAFKQLVDSLEPSLKNSLLEIN